MERAVQIDSDLKVWDVPVWTCHFSTCPLEPSFTPPNWLRHMQLHARGLQKLIPHRGFILDENFNEYYKYFTLAATNCGRYKVPAADILALLKQLTPAVVRKGTAEPPPASLLLSPPAVFNNNVPTEETSTESNVSSPDHSGSYSDSDVSEHGHVTVDVGVPDTSVGAIVEPGSQLPAKITVQLAHPSTSSLLGTTSAFRIPPDKTASTESPITVSTPSWSSPRAEAVTLPVAFPQSVVDTPANILPKVPVSSLLPTVEPIAIVTSVLAKSQDDVWVRNLWNIRDDGPYRTLREVPVTSVTPVVNSQPAVTESDLLDFAISEDVMLSLIKGEYTVTEDHSNKFSRAVEDGAPVEELDSVSLKVDSVSGSQGYHLVFPDVVTALYYVRRAGEFECIFCSSTASIKDDIRRHVARELLESFGQTSGPAEAEKHDERSDISLGSTSSKPSSEDDYSPEMSSEEGNETSEWDSTETDTSGGGLDCSSVASGSRQRSKGRWWSEKQFRKGFYCLRQFVNNSKQSAEPVKGTPRAVWNNLSQEDKEYWQTQAEERDRIRAEIVRDWGISYYDSAATEIKRKVGRELVKRCRTARGGVCIMTASKMHLGNIGAAI